MHASVHNKDGLLVATLLRSTDLCAVGDNVARFVSVVQVLRVLQSAFRRTGTEEIVQIIRGSSDLLHEQGVRHLLPRCDRVLEVICRQREATVVTMICLGGLPSKPVMYATPNPSGTTYGDQYSAPTEHRM